MRTVLVVVAVGVGLYVVVRSVQAFAHGAPVVATLTRPTVPVAAVAAAAKVEKNANTGAGHF
jgi:hypothetical protein